MDRNQVEVVNQAHRQNAAVAALEQQQECFGRELLRSLEAQRQLQQQTKMEMGNAYREYEQIRSRYHSIRIDDAISSNNEAMGDRAIVSSQRPPLSIPSPPFVGRQGTSRGENCDPG